MREQLREQTKQYEKSENDLKALQSVGQVKGCLNTDILISNTVVSMRDNIVSVFLRLLARSSNS